MPTTPHQPTADGRAGPGAGPGALAGLPDNWGATAAEMAEPWPCAGLLEGPVTSLWRAVTVDAPPAVLWRWLCQLRVAPYSYDLIDNWGRRSPSALTPGAEAPAVGDPLMVFRLTEVVPGVEMTGRGLPGPEALFGPLAGTYRVRPYGTGSRLVVRLDVGAGGTPAARLRRRLLAWGDLVMMRKQLLTLKRHAERQARAARLADAGPGAGNEDASGEDTNGAGASGASPGDEGRGGGVAGPVVPVPATVRQEPV
jgi:hypothetical protein